MPFLFFWLVALAMAVIISGLGCAMARDNPYGNNQDRVAFWDKWFRIVLIAFMAVGSLTFLLASFGVGG